jgi:Carboxypeptidase regulatory-like domain
MTSVNIFSIRGSWGGLLISILLMQTVILHAQLTRGFISGIVSDSSGAIIQSAQITITSKSTNQVRKDVTNEAGVYRFVAVEPGIYQIDFSASGFEPLRFDDVHVYPAAEIVLNESLTVQGGATTIDVVEPVDQLGFSQATPTIEKTFDEESVLVLPTTVMRDVTRLALLAPTVLRAPGSNQFSANGQRARQSNFLIDGTDNNDLSVTVPNARLIPEALSAIQFQVLPYSAEYGRNTGAQVSALTRSGTNTLHGGIWDYYRGNWMEPVSLLNKRVGFTSTPGFVQHEAGGDLGGALRPDHSFFFGLLEADWRREAKDARNAQAAVIPTPAGYAALAAVPLGPGQTPASRQAVLNAMAFLPGIYKQDPQFGNVTSQTINGTPIQMGTIRIPLANPYNFWYGLFRFDERLSDRDNLTYRYLLDTRSQLDVTDNRQFGSLFTAAADSTFQNHALSLLHVFGANLTNEFRFAYSRANLAFPEKDPTDSTITIRGAFNIGGASTFPQGRISNTFQWQDITTYLLGRHSLKFGVDLRRNRFFDVAAFDSKGTWTFSTLADFLNNQALQLRQVVSNASFDARQTNQFYFVQDDVKVSKGLTVNLGLRYEYSGVPFGFFGAATPQIAAAGVPLPARPDRNNWAPRFGFAYSPAPVSGWKRKLLGDQKTVLRGGLGIAYDVLFYNILTTTASNYPRVVPYVLTQPQTVNLFPTLPPKQAVVPPFTPSTAFANTPTDIQNPTTNFWSFSVQRQLGKGSLLEIGYTGNRSYHLLRQGESNPAVLTPDEAQIALAGGSIPSVAARRLNPTWGSRATVESTGLALYHAFFLRFDRQMAKGLLLGSTYTWSENFSDSDEALAIGDIVTSSPQIPQDYRNYRNEWSRSVFDRPSRFDLHYLYDFPVPRSLRTGSSIWKDLLGGWQVSGSTEWQSGQPFTITTGVDSGGSGVPIAWRPDFNPLGIFQKDPVEEDLRTFSTPIDGTGTFLTPLTKDGAPLANSMPLGGNLGRNTFRGPAFSNWNFSLAKTISISERYDLRFRADCFDLWNHRNFGNPVATMNSAAFGTNTTDPGSRTMLLSAKFVF